MTTIDTLLGYWAGYRPDKTAIVFGDLRVSFAEHHRRVLRCAAALRSLGLRHGDSLAVVLPNCIELLELYRATALVGVVVVPVSPLLQARGVATVLHDCSAVAVVAHPSMKATMDAVRRETDAIPDERWCMSGPGCPGYRDYDELVAAASTEAPLETVAADDVWQIMYSSGTTGAPKGIVMTQRIRAMYALTFATHLGIGADSVVMHAGSLVFNGCFVTMMPAWLHGCTYIVADHFSAEDFIDTVQREAVTHVMLVPSQIAAIIDSPRFGSQALASLRMLLSLGAPLPDAHKQLLLAAIPGALYELYGLTEGFVTVLEGRDAAAHRESVGKPLPFGRMRIVDAQGRDLPTGEIGEIVGNGPLLTPGYHRQPALTAASIVDGWLHTGDLGFSDAAGFLHLVGRKKELIISGGVNVYPRDIEEVAMLHPAVAEVAVFGIPDPRWGECPVAAVVLKHDATIAADALCTWINANVAARYQRIQHVVLHREFPRNAAGKTLKRELRGQFLAGAGAVQGST